MRSLLALLGSVLVVATVLVGALMLMGMP